MPHIAWKCIVPGSANDAYTAYIEMGSPKDLTESQMEHLNELTRDMPEMKKVVRYNSPGGSVDITIPMNSNDIVMVKLSAAGQMIDLRGTHCSRRSR